MVLEKCQLYFGHPCMLFAEDDQVRTTPPGQTREPQDMPRLTYAGPYDPAQVPGVSSGSPAPQLVGAYGPAPFPKAMALHPWGSVFITTGASNQRDAEVEALRRCNIDPARQGRDGPCYLYAAGNRVVLVQRRTQALTP